jgi:hypothetical protein
MFTTFDKAIVAFLFSVVFLVEYFGAIDIPDEWMTMLAALFGPTVFMVPNKDTVTIPEDKKAVIVPKTKTVTVDGEKTPQTKKIVEA